MVDRGEGDGDVNSLMQRFNSTSSILNGFIDTSK